MPTAFPLLLSIVLALFVAAPAGAVTIDFESLPESEGDAVTSVVGAPELSISGAIRIVAGSPIVGFNGQSQGGPGGHDDAGTGDSIALGPGQVTIALTFTTTVGGLSLDLLDVEVGSVNETVTIRLYDDVAGANLLFETVRDGNSAGAGDGVALPVALSSGFAGVNQIRRVELMSTASGWALDNVTYTPVPEPALAGLLAGPALLALRTRRAA